MALFLPLMLGAMVGDVGYGVVLVGLALFARRSLAARAPALAGLAWIALAGAAWSIVFGVLYGELFGDLGKRLVGDWALWQYRPSAEALEPLLLFAVAIGAAHVVLGLGLGAWQAARFRERRTLLDKLGTLLALGGLFGLAGWAADQLPAGALTPSVAATVVGLVLVMSLHGALGIVTGALELMGTIGNILSYLRLAAVGLASAHLAAVANELGPSGRSGWASRRGLLPLTQPRPGRVQPDDPGAATPLRGVLRRVLRRRRPRVQPVRAPARATDPSTT